MKKKGKILIALVIAAIVVIALIISIRDKRVPFSRLHSVLEYRAEDIEALAIVIYDVDYEREGDFVKNVEVKLVVGDKKLVKKHFDITDAPVEEGRSYIDKIYNALPESPKGHEQMIGSLDDTGLIFFTKDGQMFLTELIDHWKSERPRIWLSMVPCKELGPVLTELLEKYGF